MQASFNSKGLQADDKQSDDSALGNAHQWLI